MDKVHNSNKTDKTIYTKFWLKKQKEREHYNDLGPHRKNIKTHLKGKRKECMHQNHLAQNKG
jgi:hypothetical protein